MIDLERAMSEVTFIRDAMIAGTRFRGLAPQAVAATGAFALATAAAQSAWPQGVAGAEFVRAWVAVAAASLGLIGGEAIIRAHRLHGGMADLMIAGTLRILLPFLAAGAIVTLVVARLSPATAWVLPGLWQMLIALAGFAALPTLPPRVAWAAGWYLACGAVVLAFGAQTHRVEPWSMGIPFGIGQLLVAWTLHQAAEPSRG